MWSALKIESTKYQAVLSVLGDKNWRFW